MRYSNILVEIFKLSIIRDYIQITKQNTIFVQSVVESNCIVKLIQERTIVYVWGFICVKINSFSFPRFISNVSIYIEDANWKISIFLHGMTWLI